MRPSAGRKAANRDSIAQSPALAGRRDITTAFRAIQAAIAADPSDWRPHFHAAMLMASTGEHPLSLGAFEKALALAAPDANTISEIAANLLRVMLENDSGRNFKVKALDIVDGILDKTSPTLDVLYPLCKLQFSLGRYANALWTAEKAVEIAPGVARHHFRHGAILVALGRGEESVAAYGRGLTPYIESNDPEKDIRSQYSALAAGYDATTLHQYFSATMTRFIVGIIGSARTKRVLDAGCGTGLLATHLRAARLVGIDQSPDMLAKAKERNIYAELVAGDLVAAMAGRNDGFDIVASICVLYHLNDLAPFFRQSARLLVPGGHLFFSTDPAPDSMDIGVTTVGEYAHSRAYLRRLAAQTGFAEVTIKIMPHRTYPGFWCAFRRQ